MSRSRADAAVLKAVVEHDQLRPRAAMACRAAATRSGFCRCGTSGSDCCSSRASSFELARRRPRSRG